MSAINQDPGDEKNNHYPQSEVRAVRCNQILDAARYCFVRKGFHASSMAEIAAHAHLSVGQIYRYFANKDALIAALVGRMTERRLEGIRSSCGWTDFDSWIRIYVYHEIRCHEDDRALVLEVQAEAARNPVVADIVRSSHQQLKEQAVQVVMARHPDKTEMEARVAVELLATLSEGMMFRQGLGGGEEDLEVTEKVLRNVLENLFLVNI